MRELSNILDKSTNNKEVLCLYTDGGPDHRVTYLSVQMAIICLFLSQQRYGYSGQDAHTEQLEKSP